MISTTDVLGKGGATSFLEINKVRSAYDDIPVSNEIVRAIKIWVRFLFLFKLFCCVGGGLVYKRPAPNDIHITSVVSRRFLINSSRKDVGANFQSDKRAFNVTMVPPPSAGSQSMLPRSSPRTI